MKRGRSKLLAAVDYIVFNGISRSRLVPTRYWET